MTYEELLNLAESNNLVVKEKPLIYHEGLIKENRIAIKQDMTEREKACALAEELSHANKNTGNIIKLSDIRNRKQEHTARLWAYDNMVGLTGLIRAYENRCQGLYEIAEYLGVTEQFLNEALTCYREKYGVSVRVDNYIIQFIPNLNIGRIIGNGL